MPPIAIGLIEFRNNGIDFTIDGRYVLLIDDAVGLIIRDGTN
ncbi:MAG: hypothetical protein ABJZ55_13995 [Fuerstiella sp.]